MAEAKAEIEGEKEPLLARLSLERAEVSGLLPEEGATKWPPCEAEHAEQAEAGREWEWEWALEGGRLRLSEAHFEPL